ncbi:hypothetical protein [Rubrobacter indicoceani]|uniref:hypothetical protein n=1 Tax=Rubrobacter indicoceani TaxID=2051957 RepID=UPI000E5C36CA|nr:hypothetical protein [Rubrobacter indicoceani]
MSNDNGNRISQELVSYTLELDGRFYIVENVPARVDVETGERFFSPETVERLHKTILGDEAPAKVIETPVYDFSG